VWGCGVLRLARCRRRRRMKRRKAGIVVLGLLSMVARVLGVDCCDAWLPRFRVRFWVLLVYEERW
jgi:hypothetical protein